jgi:hypothetical protein
MAASRRAAINFRNPNYRLAREEKQHRYRYAEKFNHVRERSRPIP